MNFEAMGSEDSRSLEIWFYEEEAYGTLSNLCEDKSPWFDGFHYGIMAIMLRLCKARGDEYF